MNTKRQFLRQSAALCGFAGLSAWPQLAAAAPNPKAPQWVVGQRAALPPLPLLQGGVETFDKTAGRVVMLEFWHTRCPFCARQNPVLDAFYRRHKDQGLSVYAIHIDNKQPAEVKRYIDQHGYAFTVGLADPTWQALFKQRKGLPQLFVIDRQQRLQRIELGEMFAEDLNDLSQLL